MWEQRILGTSEVNANHSLSRFQRSFLGYASFKVGELLKSKEQLLALSLRWVSACTNAVEVNSRRALLKAGWVRKSQFSRMLKCQLSHALPSSLQQVILKQPSFKFTFRFVFHVVKGYQPLEEKKNMYRVLMKAMKFFDSKKVNRNDEHAVK